MCTNEKLTCYTDELNRVFKENNAGKFGGKAQAKRKAHVRSEDTITMAEKENFDVDMEQHRAHISDPLFDEARFKNMTFEDLDDQYINIDVGENKASIQSQHHQADPADITLPDKVDLSTMHTDPFDRVNRFTVGDDDSCM